MRHITKRALLTLILCLLVPLGANADQPVDRTVPAAASGTVEIENISGSITVEGWDRNEIHVSGTLGDDVEALKVETKGDRTVIEVKLPEGNHRGDKEFSADLVIQIPRDSGVRTQLVSSSATVSGVLGGLELQTVSGVIKVDGEPRELDIQTVSGGIHADVRTDEVELETVSGGVELRGSFREVSINAVSSDLQLDLGTVERAALQTVSGNLVVSADPGPNARLEIQAHSGDVKLTLPGGLSADFDINTFSGDIENGFGPPAKRTSEYAPGKSLDFSTGGGARIEVQGFSGDIHLIKG
jgi:DUF4097 and DUF4098 domain-containing protein YvlB